MRLREHVVTAACLLLLAAISLHFYRQPIYDMDMVGYLGNALLMKESNVARVHDQVYAEMRRALPPEAFEALTGKGGLRIKVRRGRRALSMPTILRSSCPSSPFGRSTT